MSISSSQSPFVTRREGVSQAGGISVTNEASPSAPEGRSRRTKARARGIILGDAAKGARDSGPDVGLGDGCWQGEGEVERAWWADTFLHASCRLLRV